ncbi:TFIIB-type zinc ribbon-containing protein [Paenibacillus paeoniae]|uniref:TFIIB-type zinc ribbon-containing protein n=1 Tax=Paenibacillus paeoniae TaxID=2292705 RepID=A0A371PE84_9BACL|nr:TFIIB-type zinc ribbon-containing protein [Paenibacillus paeoniae]REK74251.1 TFIIB-type zinc ribbon-containing protein [Paenibacillus paeoniae]
MAVLDYKCPNCGGEMAFDSASGMLSCGSCGRKDNIEQSSDAPNPSVFAHGEAKEYQCNSCGAVIVTEPETTATMCSFCNSSVVLIDRMAGGFAPAKVIPFAISKAEAQKAFQKWCKNGRLTPGAFMKANRIKGVTGLYVPFWLYDLHSDVEVRAHGTKVRSYTRGDYMYTETQHFDVYRDIVLDYVKVPVDASEKMNDELMDKLEPFPYDQLKNFKTPYLAGFIAEKYNFDDRQLMPRAQHKVDGYIDSYVRSTMSHYHTVTYQSKDVDTTSRKAEHVLLPVWMFHYDYNRKKYTFAMNGQTGKVVGRPPISLGKMTLWFSGIFLASLISVKILSAAMGGGFW